MEWLNIIVGFVTTFIGLVGGGIGIFFWRENKALKQKEVEKAAIENELQQADAWKALFQQEHEKCERKSAEKRQLYAERDKLKEEINACHFRVQQLTWYHCTVNGCTRRKPPHKFDADGTELSADEDKKVTREGEG